VLHTFGLFKRFAEGRFDVVGKAAVVSAGTAPSTLQKLAVKPEGNRFPHQIAFVTAAAVFTRAIRLMI
jgi:hypothetical protein